MKLRRQQLEAIFEQLEGVDREHMQCHISGDNEGSLQMTISDRWGVDHLQISPSGFITRIVSEPRRRG